MLQRLHDVRMVRPPEATGAEDLHKLAPYRSDTLLMGGSLLRVLRTGAGKQDRLCRKRRSVQPHAAEDHPGGDLSYSLYDHGNRNVQGTVAPMEPFCGILLPYHGSFLRFFEVKGKINLEV